MWRWLLAVAWSVGCFAAEDRPLRRQADPAPSATHPFATFAVAPEQQSSFEGMVEERLAAGSYVYLRVRAAERPDGVWVASLAATTPDVDRVSVLVLGRADLFHSRRLQRDFQPLLFGAIRTATARVPGASKGMEP